MISDHRPQTRTQTPDMTDSKMDEIQADRKLKGKTNFISWKREFERVVKTNDIFEYLTGEEVVPSKPQTEYYFVKPTEVDIRRSIRTKKTAQTFTPLTDDDDETENAQSMKFTNNSLRWQIDYKEHENAKKKMKFADRLLDAWISDNIKIEIQDCADANEVYNFVKERYAVTNERARDSLVNQLNELKL